MRRPDAAIADAVQRFPKGMPHLERFKTPDVRNRSFEIGARVDLSAGGDGVLVASGSRMGGMSLHVAGGLLQFDYNFLGKVTCIASAEALDPAATEVGVTYTKTAEHHGEVELFAVVGGARQVLAGAELDTMPFRQTLYGMDVGKDLGPTVTANYEGPNEFSGGLSWVEFRLQHDRDDLMAAAAVEAENALADQ
jgi:arylsulfatase